MNRINIMAMAFFIDELLVFQPIISNTVDASLPSLYELGLRWFAFYYAIHEV